MEFRIPFSGRAHEYTDNEILAVTEAMRSAVPLTQGIYQQAFQAKFKQYVGANHAFAVNNATAALEMASQLCLLKECDEVIIPGHTFTASAYPFLKRGATIVWADIDPETRVVTAETIERCITPRSKAIVVVHLYGYGAGMSAIMDLAHKHNLLVVEDAAQALGVEIDGQMAGTFGDFGVYSFHSHKNITTLGEGGMLTVREERFAKMIPLLRHNGHCAFDYEREYYWIPAMGNVDLPMMNGEILWPNNYCLGEVECALGAELLDRIDQINADKRRRAIAFIDTMENYQELEFHRENTERHNYHLLAAKLANGKRDQFIRKISEEESVQCIVQYYPLYRYDFYKKVNQDQAKCPNTDHFFDNMVSFPFHHMMTDEDVDFMAHAAKRVLADIR